MMQSPLNEQQQTEILKALDTALANPVWDKSNFLRVIGKRLTTLRSHVQEAFSGKLPDQQVIPLDSNNRPSQADLIPVFVSLYAAKGGELASWERILSTLPKQIMSRPIYTEEKDAIALIKSKLNKMNEAYLCLSIETAQVLTLPEAKIPHDKLGHPLLTLKGRPIPSNFEATFIHESGRYNYTKGKLTRLPE